MLDVALIQLTSGPVIGDNLAAAEALIRQAAAGGARFILTPENTCHMVFPASAKLGSSPPEAEHPALKLFAGLAAELGVTLLLGSIAVRVRPDKMQNRSYLFGPGGGIIARYDKIHLFDAALANNEIYAESDHVLPGTQAVVAEAAFGRVGLTICYDLRFAGLFRALAKAGAAIIAVPSAFTVPTGQAHWQALLRARAIETGCFILAPAQTGEHAGGRKTWGHSLIVDPWGAILAEADDRPGILAARLDLAMVENARRALPSLQHDRAFDVMASP